MPKPKTFCLINDRPIYHVHKHGYGKGREAVYLYSTSGTKGDTEHSEYLFDVRDFGAEGFSTNLYWSSTAILTGLACGSLT